MADAAAAAMATGDGEAGPHGRVEDPALRVRVLIDETRGTRGAVSSCSLLEPLLSTQHGASAKGRCDVKISLYHTPKVGAFPFQFSRV